MSVQVFALHSAYGLTVTAAAIDAGLLGDADERVLVTMNTAAVPETAPDLGTVSRLGSLRGRFDRVVALNPLVDPRHPTQWQPDEQDLPMLERLIRRAWGLEGAELELFVQSPQVAPARTLMALFATARLGVVADGLMTYAPIRSRLSRLITERVTHILYPDIVPGVVPVVFTEVGATAVPVPIEVFGAVLRETGEAEPDAALQALVAEPRRTGLALGQYLAALGLVSAAEESRMQLAMIDRLADAGVARIVFKPHPASPPALTDALAARAGERGVEFETYRGDQSAEFVAIALGVTDVAAGFSTALPTVSALLGIRTHAVGTDTVLARLKPYENSNRMPATIVDAMERGIEGAELQRLVDAVGYAMQPEIVGYLRERTVEVLAGMPAADRERYVPEARLQALDLPGAPERTALRRLAVSDGGVGRLEELRLTVAGARRRARRVWKAARGR